MTGTQYFKRASEAGSNGYAERNLGEMYWNGNGVASDPSIARSWYEKGAERGDAEAKKWLEDHPA